jgi:hypothetical protein
VSTPHGSGSDPRDPAEPRIAVTPESTTEPTPDAKRDGRLDRARTRVASLWASVRPRTRRGAVLGFAGIAALSCVFSVAFLAGAGVFAGFYDEYGFHPQANAARWAALQPAFADPALCADCHATEYAKATSASHAGIGCESCHGPLLAHALASPGTEEAAVAVAVPTDELCERCHVATTGRPATFRQIVPADHYEPVCLQCHDPHTGISRRPPVVEHPIDDHLPPCVTCHGPDGFKARDQRHPDVGENDAACLACHLPGRGPDETEVEP